MVIVPTWPDIKTIVLARTKSSLVYVTSSWCHMPVVFNLGHVYPPSPGLREDILGGTRKKLFRDKILITRTRFKVS
jgi:hypothetical protein